MAAACTNAVNAACPQTRGNGNGDETGQRATRICPDTVAQVFWYLQANMKPMSTHQVLSAHFCYGAKSEQKVPLVAAAPACLSTPAATCLVARERERETETDRGRDRGRGRGDGALSRLSREVTKVRACDGFASMEPHVVRGRAQSNSARARERARERQGRRNTDSKAIEANCRRTK